MRDKWDELRKLHHPAPRWAERCYADGESWPCLTSQLLDENEKLRAATAELRKGDGTYYLTEERAFAPGIADGWPSVIPAPHTKHGRLVKRRFPALGDAP